MDGLQDLWQSIHSSVPEFYLRTFVTLSLIYAFYWPLTFLFMALDLSKRPTFITKYKIQSTKHVTMNDYKQVFKWGAINLTFVLLPLSVAEYLFTLHFMGEGWGIRSTEQLPSLMEVVKDLVIFVIVEEIGFFYTHYIMHQPTLYKAIHKFHHTFKAPVAGACIYAHPLEMLISNSLPLLAGPFLANSHIVTAWIWYVLAIMSTIYDHSGYKFPFTHQTGNHDLHHEAFNYNFGVLGILDALHGTSRSRADHLLSLSKSRSKSD